MKLFLLSFSALLFCMSNVLFSQEIKPLYQGKIPNYIQGVNKQKTVTTGGMDRIESVSIPTYQFFESKQGNGIKPCVIICPGGGYRILASTHEGTDIAKKFNEIGVHAYILYYRIPDSSSQVDRTYAPLQDAQEAIRMVRKNAASWGIDPQKVGIMGFSAGGHLASTAATHFQKDYLNTNDGANLRPDFQILMYPVISFRSFGHKGSALNLLGKNPSEELLHLFSNEEQISENTPKAFLVHAADDKTVPVKNSLAFVENLTQFNVPADLHVYAKGGHGFGLNNKTTKELWFDRLTEWLKTNQLL